jgi:17beta-estradiol 17-dehydrogenase / very-long-chain 3-oxoacyl-CoA reductase
MRCLIRNAKTDLFLNEIESDTNATAVAFFGAIGAAIVAFKALGFLKVLVDVFLRSGINV